jgi:hypothetical protein
LAYAISLLNQQLGLASNGRDASERISQEAVDANPDQEEANTDEEYATTRSEARDGYESRENSTRIRPVEVPTRRGLDQFQQIREALARLELTDRMTFAKMILETAPRLPRDATAIAILPQVPVETAVALGQLRRQGFAVSAILIGFDDESDDKPVAFGRLMSEGIRDIRVLNCEDDLINLGSRQAGGPSKYNVAVTLA